MKIAQNKAKEAGEKVDFRQGDAAEMPFPDGTFDFAVCTSAFKNFPDPIKVLDEIFRVLKASGKALIIERARFVEMPTMRNRTAYKIKKRMELQRQLLSCQNVPMP